MRILVFVLHALSFDVVALRIKAASQNAIPSLACGYHYKLPISKVSFSWFLSWVRDVGFFSIFKIDKALSSGDGVRKMVT